MKNITALSQMEELTHAELETAAGGHPFEECFGDTARYRAGVSYQNVVFGSDRYYVGSTQISKSLAKTLRSESKKLWEDKYSKQADLVGYLREWKQILDDKYDIEWDGKLGTYEAKAY